MEQLLHGSLVTENWNTLKMVHMKLMTRLLEILLLAGLAGVANASLLNDDSILYSVNLTTSSGNFISSSGSIIPETDAYCFFTATVGCPPGTEWDKRDLNGLVSDWDLGVWFDVQDNVINMFIFDFIFGESETVSGTITYSNIGWGPIEGAIIGGATCGLSTLAPGLEAQCDETLGGAPTFSADAVTLVIDSYELIPTSNNGAAGGQAVGFLVEHAVPAPATLALFGLGLAGLGWSRRNKI